MGLCTLYISVWGPRSIHFMICSQFNFILSTKTTDFLGNFSIYDGLMLYFVGLHQITYSFIFPLVSKRVLILGSWSANNSQNIRAILNKTWYAYMDEDVCDVIYGDIITNLLNYNRAKFHQDWSNTPEDSLSR